VVADWLVEYADHTPERAAEQAATLAEDIATLRRLVAESGYTTARAELATRFTDDSIAVTEAELDRILGSAGIAAPAEEREPAVAAPTTTAPAAAAPTATTPPSPQVPSASTRRSTKTPLPAAAPPSPTPPSRTPQLLSPEQMRRLSRRSIPARERLRERYGEAEPWGWQRTGRDGVRRG
jgi:hypothetical protein